MIKRKLKVWINTDYCGIKSGLGRNCKELLIYLYKTNKYDLGLYGCGTSWENPDYQRYPFLIRGTLPNTQQELDQINKDPNYARDCSYGLYYIDRLIKEYKPDVLMMFNDTWASQRFLDKIWWNKIHCVPAKTIDSLPLLLDQKKYIEKSKDFFVWSEFAENEAKRLGYNNVKTIPGIISSKYFFKLPKYRKQELKQKFNLPPNSFIAGFVFRNQLRKEVGVLLEGYSIFKKQNPEIKNTYLLLHTHWQEPGGWDIHRFCDEYGINKEEILTTYVCRNCQEIEIKPYTGQDLNCRFCGVNGSNQGAGQVTCQVGVGCSEEQLNEVYNLMDCYIHLFNAGGLEMPIVEALYCELPLATVAYACGETFTNQSFVHSIDFSWTIQQGTQFKRSIPYPYSVAKYLKKIYDTSENERLKIGKQGREWALSKFTAEVIGKQWEEYLDSLPLIDWNYDFNIPLKNPDAIIPNIEDNVEWLKYLYDKILNMKVDINDSGLIYWMTSLKQGAQRKDIEAFFRNKAIEENQKNHPKTINLEDLLDKNGKKRFLMVLKQSAGDIIMATSLLKSWRENHPEDTWDLYFCTMPQYFDLLDGNPYISKLLPWHEMMESEVLMTGQNSNKGFFNGFCLIGLAAQYHLSYLTNDNIGLQLQK